MAGAVLKARRRGQKLKVATLSVKFLGGTPADLAVFQLRQQFPPHV